MGALPRTDLRRHRLATDRRLVRHARAHRAVAAALPQPRGRRSVPARPASGTRPPGRRPQGNRPDPLSRLARRHRRVPFPPGPACRRRTRLAGSPALDHRPRRSRVPASPPGEYGMNIVERSVSAGDRAVFDLEEFLSRPLHAHLAHNSDQGPRESPVWFHWDGHAVWIIGGTSFPANLKRDPRCALGIVDWDPATGLSHHVGTRGKAEVLPFDRAMARTILRRYFGPDEGTGTRASTTRRPAKNPA